MPSRHLVFFKWDGIFELHNSVLSSVFWGFKDQKNWKVEVINKGNMTEFINSVKQQFITRRKNMGRLTKVLSANVLGMRESKKQLGFIALVLGFLLGIPLTAFAVPSWTINGFSFAIVYQDCPVISWTITTVYLFECFRRRVQFL